MKRVLTAMIAAAFAAAAADAQTQPRAGEAAFRSLYKELVETNTTLSSGSCTDAAAKVAARLRAAGYADAELTPFSVPEHPREGGLVAVLPGRDAKAKAILLLAHLDVVEARAADWTRDPFTLIEENGVFYGRGTADDKAMAAIYADTLIRLRAEPRPRRTIKLVLTCGEETNGAFNGAAWLAENRRALIDADFALNEGGGGRLGVDGKPQLLALQVGEKTSQNYTLEARNPGGHSSLPRPDNAIADLAAAVTRVQGHQFPVRLNDTTRAFFARGASSIGGPAAGAMTRIAADPGDAAAAALLSRDPSLNAALRTTCVTTLLEAGHAENALPQRAQANVNCRIIPGETVAGTRNALVAAIGNPAVIVTAKVVRGPEARPVALDPRVLGPAEDLARTMFPGVPVVPTMSSGASDSVFLAAVGIPSYGVPGVMFAADLGGMHGLNENISVKSVLDGRDYLHALIRRYADAR